MRHKENDSNTTEETEFEAPFWINWPIDGVFVLKLIPLAWGYAWLVNFLFKAWI